VAKAHNRKNNGDGAEGRSRRGSANRQLSREIESGADRDRTGDPLLAKQVLSQLSYRPEGLPR
jgi:hypothetical protein